MTESQLSTVEIPDSDATGSAPVVRTEVRDGVGILTLNRPHVRNALNLSLREAM